MNKTRPRDLFPLGTPIFNDGDLLFAKGNPLLPPSTTTLFSQGMRNPLLSKELYREQFILEEKDDNEEKTTEAEQEAKLKFWKDLTQENKALDPPGSFVNTGTGMEAKWEMQRGDPVGQSDRKVDFTLSPGEIRLLHSSARMAKSAQPPTGLPKARFEALLAKMDAIQTTLDTRNAHPETIANAQKAKAQLDAIMAKFEPPEPPRGRRTRSPSPERKSK